MTAMSSLSSVSNLLKTIKKVVASYVFAVDMEKSFASGFSQSEEISLDLCCFYGGGISHNEDAFFSKVYCCLILNYPTPIEIWIWKLVVRALICLIIWPVFTRRDLICILLYLKCPKNHTCVKSKMLFVHFNALLRTTALLRIPPGP